MISALLNFVLSRTPKSFNPSLNLRTILLADFLPSRSFSIAYPNISSGSVEFAIRAACAKGVVVSFACSDT